MVACQVGWGSALARPFGRGQALHRIPLTGELIEPFWRSATFHLSNSVENNTMDAKDANELRMIALVNLLADSFYPDPEDPGPAGPWGPWIKEAISSGPFAQPWRYGPLPDPWLRHDLGANTESKWWQDYHPGPPPYWKAALADLLALAGQVDDHANPFGGQRPRPNWAVLALLRDIASLNPQPLPPVDSVFGFARRLATVALRRSREAGGEEGSRLLHRFADDWCGNNFRIPPLPAPRPGEPRPPRPEESLVLGAALFRGAASSDPGALMHAAEAAGRKVFAHGISQASPTGP